MLETQYQREVIDKLAELKTAIEGICGTMRAQSELLGKKILDCQDKVDRSLYSLQQLSTVSIRHDDDNVLSDSEVFSLNLNDSQMTQ